MASSPEWGIYILPTDYFNYSYYITSHGHNETRPDAIHHERKSIHCVREITVIATELVDNHCSIWVDIMPVTMHRAILRVIFTERLQYM